MLYLITTQKNAIIYGLWGPINYVAAKDGITGFKVQYLSYAQPWAFDFAPDYKGCCRLTDNNYAAGRHAGKCSVCRFLLLTAGKEKYGKIYCKASF